ncbi:MAG: DNA-binding protein WhiA [Bacilli bacterium]|nr:DNA-binding protein WhiA [Bacilli bacterium]
MTFSGKIKEEVSKLDVDKIELVSELSGIFCTNADIKLYSIRVQTENLNAANRIFNIVKDVYDVTSNITVKKNYNFKKNEIYIIEIKKNVPEIIKDIGLIGETGFVIDEIPKEEIVADDNLKSAFVRGSFLISGSVNDPKTSRYHLEIISNNAKHAEFLRDLINSFNLNSKVLRRKKGYMVYIKESEKISDFLKMIKAYNGVMYFEDIRIYREKVNMNNRINNCEQANVEKSMASSNKQISDINYIKERDAYELLDDKVRLVAEYRVKYPDSSLIELSEIISVETNNKITKSCVNHRLRKIKDLADKLKGKENE